MQALARLSVSRPVVATVLILIFVVVGSFSIPKLGVDRFPNIDIPYVVVQTTLRGATPEEMDTLVTEEIEKQVNTISGIDILQSTASDGVSIVVIGFKLEKDGDVAANEVRAKVDLALPNLPKDVDKPIVMKVDPGSTPVLSVALSAPGVPVRELTEFADKKLCPQIENINGVGEVAVVGGQARQINVMLDPYALRAYGLTAVDVKNALASQNLQVPGGALDQGDQRISVRTQGRAQNMQEMEDLVIQVRQGQPIRVRDVARVEDGEEEAQSLANVDGQRAVLLNIRKQSGTNTVAVIDAVKERLDAVRPNLPRGYDVRIVSDQSDYIKAALHAVEEHLILGAILASLVVLLFLWNWRSALIASIAIPASLISTFALMAIQGFTLNVVTLLALTLAVGIVIDDAVIVLENIYRYLEEKQMSPREAALAATQEIGLAVLATTFSLIAVFVPIAFMSGIVGRMLNSFGLTMAFAILMSLIVAFTLAPMLSARWLKRPKETLHRVVSGEGLRGPVSPRKRQDVVEEVLEAETDVRPTRARANGNGHRPQPPAGGEGLGLFRRFEAGYAGVLRWALGHRWVVVLGCIGAIFSVVPLGRACKVNFFPDDDESKFSVSVRAPEGTSLQTTEALMNRIAADIRKLPEVTYTLVTVGEDNQRTQNLGSILVQMNRVEDRKTRITQMELMDRVRKETLPRYPRDLRVRVAPPSIVGGGGQAQVTYAITGPDLDQVIRAANRVVAELKQFPAAVDCDTSAVVGKPEISVAVDRNAAADLGVSVADIATTLRTLVAGEKVSDFAEGGFQYDVNLRAIPTFRDHEENLSLFTVRSTKPEVGAVPLSQVVSYRDGVGPSVIERYARQRQVTVSANPAPGASQQEVQKKIEELFKAQNLGPLYHGHFSGSSRELGRTMSSFLMAFMLAAIFAYLILAAQFESWVMPLVILTALPLTLPFALFSVWFMRGSLNIFSLLGILVLFGVVMKNAILQVDHTNGLRAEGMERAAAIVQACRDRLRPILMTTIAFVAGMIPLAISSGTGAGTNRAMSHVIIGGQVLSLLLTLVATPVLYTLADDIVNFGQRLMARIFRRHPEEQELENIPLGERELDPVE